MIKRCPYTLLEIIVVIAIITLVAGVITVNFTKLRLDKSTFDLAEELRRMGALCRRYAVAQGKSQEILYYHEKRVLKFDKDSILLPEGTKFFINGKEPDEDLRFMKFFPDGNATVVTIEFISNETVAGVKVSR